MSTAHGAGLMVAPVLIGLQGVSAASAHSRASDSTDVGMLSNVPLIPSGIGIALHVLAMLAVMGVIAVVVYEKVGLEVLRRAWVNTDRLWAATFIVAAAFTLLTA
jgi:cation transporter-like permease